MDDVVARLARLRALKARMAQAELARAEARWAEARAVEQAWSERLARAASGVMASGGDAAVRGVFALNGEMKRRGAQADVEAAAAEVEAIRRRVRHLEREQKIAERLAERRAAQRAEARRRREQAELDELARLGWWRGEDG